MKIIRGENALFKGRRIIKLQFSYDTDLISRIRKIPGSEWSASMRCWLVPYSDESFNSIKSLIEEEIIQLPEFEKLQEDRRFKFFDKTLPENKLEMVMAFQHWLESQRYSERTVASYVAVVKTFLSFFSGKEIDQIINEDVIFFNYNYIRRNHLSSSYQNQMISAIKLFFITIVKREIVLEEIKRPRMSRPLPNILSKDEVEILLGTISNLKHKTMLALIYACGLRKGELLSLRITDVDSARKLLVIKGAKGNKDRVVPLPEGIIRMLRSYYTANKPKYWLFEGQKAGERYSDTSLQTIFKRAVTKGGIKKAVTLHSLRHSYATHLLENGIDLRYIQELLEHKSSKTTEIYTHVTEKSIEKIKSPFENLNL